MSCKIYYPKPGKAMKVDGPLGYNSFCREEEGFMKKSKLFKGDQSECSKECAKNEWCNSYDLCSKENGNTFCHLKDADWNTYRKGDSVYYLKSGKKGTDLFGWRNPNTQILTISSNSVKYFVGEE